MSRKLIFLALLVWQLDDPGAVLRWAAMPPPAPPLPPRPSAGLAGLDSFLQEMDEILTNSNIHSTTGEVARAPGHEGRQRRLLEASAAPPRRGGLAEPFGVRFAVREARAEAVGWLSQMAGARPNSAGPDTLCARPRQHIDALMR